MDATEYKKQKSNLNRQARQDRQETHRQKRFNVALTGARRLERVRVERVVGRHYRRDAAGATTASLNPALSKARRTTPVAFALSMKSETNPSAAGRFFGTATAVPSPT
jgi:hypothetical protein